MIVVVIGIMVLQLIVLLAICGWVSAIARELRQINKRADKYKWN